MDYIYYIITKYFEIAYTNWARLVLVGELN